MGKKKDKDKTQNNSSDLLVAVVLDKSGSMESCRAATISGFNEFLHHQDAFAAGAQMGVCMDSTLSYASSDTRQTYGIASNSATQYRTGARSADNLVRSRP